VPVGPDGAREVAVRVLERVERGEPADSALDRELRRARPTDADRRLATEIVYGVLRRLNLVDYSLDAYSSRSMSSVEPWVRQVLRVAAYQMLFLDGVPAYAAVNEAVEAARRRGREEAGGFINGLLRALARRGAPRLPAPTPDRLRYLALKHSHPEWLVHRWVRRWGEGRAERIMEANNRVPPLSVRVNRLRATRDQVRSTLAAEGVRTVPGALLPEALVLVQSPPVRSLRSFRRGLFQVQDESSMLATRILDPSPGETVIDACAAPGGKATHAAELMDDRGVVLAVDASRRRLRLISENCSRLGISIVDTVCGDARDLREATGATADRVLVDAPCSALGTLSRNPDARWRKDAASIVEAASLQLDILRGAARCVRPGGVLVYCTCTVEPEENEETVEAFLGLEPEFRAEPLGPWLPAELSDAPGASEGMLTLLPGEHGTDGFFAARLKRGI